jgi:hypothetical protein
MARTCRILRRCCDGDQGSIKIVESVATEPLYLTPALAWLKCMLNELLDVEGRSAARLDATSWQIAQE